MRKEIDNPRRGSLTRYGVGFVVTEYGIADLKYKRTKKANNLIRVAHPQHQGWLQREAARLGFT